MENSIKAFPDDKPVVYFYGDSHRVTLVVKGDCMSKSYTHIIDILDKCENVSLLSRADMLPKIRLKGEPSDIFKMILDNPILLRMLYGIILPPTNIFGKLQLSSHERLCIKYPNIQEQTHPDTHSVFYFDGFFNSPSDAYHHCIDTPGITTISSLITPYLYVVMEDDEATAFKLKFMDQQSEIVELRSIRHLPLTAFGVPEKLEPHLQFSNLYW